jgi:hypothetical protein
MDWLGGVEVGAVVGEVHAAEGAPQTPNPAQKQPAS